MGAAKSYALSGNRKFTGVLKTLVSRDYNVLLTVPDETEYVGSAWMYPNLARSLTESPIRTRSEKLPIKRLQYFRCTY